MSNFFYNKITTEDFHLNFIDEDPVPYGSLVFITNVLLKKEYPL